MFLQGFGEGPEQGFLAEIVAGIVGKFDFFQEIFQQKESDSDSFAAVLEKKTSGGQFLSKSSAEV